MPVERERSPFELMIALDESRRRPIDVNAHLATSMLRQLGLTDRDKSIFELARNKGEPFVDAMATLRVLDDSGLVEIKTVSRMEGRVVLTDQGRAVAERFLGVPPLPPKPEPKPKNPAKPVAAVETVAPEAPVAETVADAADAVVVATETQPVPPLQAVSRPSAMTAFTGIATSRERGSTADEAGFHRVLKNLLEYSDQPLSRLAKRTDLGLVETMETARVLRNAGLVFLASSMTDDRARLTEDGRRLALALRQVEAPQKGGAELA